MSTYGTAFVVDIESPAAFEPPPLIRNNDHTGFRSTAPDGWSRWAVYTSEIEAVQLLLDALPAEGRSRIAIAEDNDEYGTRWVVAAADSGKVDILHRRYILNADPDDPEAVEAAVEDLGADPRLDDITSPQSLDAIAGLFDVPAVGLREADAESENAWEELGTVGGPFPWWAALALPWPVPSAGEPLNW